MSWVGSGFVAGRVPAGMRRALRLARRGVGWAWPSETVGAVAEGSTGEADHAQTGPPSGAGRDESWTRGPGDDPVARLLSRASGGVRDLWLTGLPEGFEPGRLAGHGVRRLSIADVVPPENRRRLEDIVPHVDVGLAPDLVRELNRAPRFRRASGRPLAVLKAATSLDGRIATRTGESKWITGPRARAWGRRLRAEADGIVVGITTVMADDPQLTTRLGGYRDPTRIVLDSRLRLPTGSALARSASRTPTVVLTTAQAPPAARQALEAVSVEVVVLPATPAGQVAPEAVIAWAAERGWSSLLLEGGRTLHGAFVDADLVDRVAWFVAPVIVGGRGLPAVGGEGAGPLSDALRLTELRHRKVGRDLLVEGIVTRDTDSR